MQHSTVQNRNENRLNDIKMRMNSDRCFLCFCFFSLDFFHYYRVFQIDSESLRFFFVHKKLVQFVAFIFCFFFSQFMTISIWNNHCCVCLQKIVCMLIFARLCFVFFDLQSNRLSSASLFKCNFSSYHSSLQWILTIMIQRCAERWNVMFEQRPLAAAQ